MSEPAVTGGEKSKEIRKLEEQMNKLRDMVMSRNAEAQFEEVSWELGEVDDDPTPNAPWGDSQALWTNVDDVSPSAPAFSRPVHQYHRGCLPREPTESDIESLSALGGVSRDGTSPKAAAAEPNPSNEHVDDEALIAEIDDLLDGQKGFQEKRWKRAPNSLGPRIGYDKSKQNFWNDLRRVPPPPLKKNSSCFFTLAPLFLRALRHPHVQSW